MKDKLNQAGFVVICYGLSMLFVILITLIFEDGVVVVDDISKLGVYFFIIKPLPYVIAFYLITGLKELKVEAHIYSMLYKQDLADKDDKLKYYRIEKDAHLAQIDIYEKEIFRLKQGKVYVVDENGIAREVNTAKEVITNKKDNTTTHQWICPKCGKEMTRQTDKIVFCDNIECTRKQWKKSVL